jgi:hypothetical protein
MVCVVLPPRSSPRMDPLTLQKLIEVLKKEPSGERLIA